MNIHAIRIHEYGGPEQMRWETIELPPPGPGEVQVRHRAVGLNYIDVYHRTGIYPTPPLPCILGMEAAGVVEATGSGVTDFSVGDRVAYASPPLGAYAEARNIAQGRLVALPDAIDFDTAAAMMLQGMTAEYLLRRTYPVRAGQTVLFHAAAGGVGLIFCQWAKTLGATVIGTVGSEEKAEIARAHGCDHTILYREENVVERVKAKDPVQLAQAVDRLLEDVALRERLGNQARRDVEQRFAAEAVLQRLLDLYREVRGKAVREAPA